MHHAELWLSLYLCLPPDWAPRGLLFIYVILIFPRQSTEWINENSKKNFGPWLYLRLSTHRKFHYLVLIDYTFQGRRALKLKMILSFPHLTGGTSISPYLVQLPKCMWWSETSPPWSISGKAVFPWAKSLRFRHSNLGSVIIMFY